MIFYKIKSEQFILIFIFVVLYIFISNPLFLFKRFFSNNLLKRKNDEIYNSDRDRFSDPSLYDQRI